MVGGYGGGLKSQQLPGSPHRRPTGRGVVGHNAPHPGGIL